MAKIAFILLCHKDPDAIIAQAEQLTASGDVMAIHFDRNSPSAAWAKLNEALGPNPNVVFAKKRQRCGWGEWSLVQATLNAIEAAVDAFPRATHFYMISGDCAPIKTQSHAHNLLQRENSDFIESFDFFESEWIKTGFKEERLIYRHWFNERARKKLFYASFEFQKWMGWERKIPSDLDIMIGSQWWCLRRKTIEAILEFTKARRDVVRFFRTTWIPDETYFQTLVRHLVPSSEIQCKTLTFLMFSDYGMPVTFYDDHYDLLLSQGFLFARKISPEAKELRTRLGALYTQEGAEFTVSNEGQKLLKFLTGRGREGRRFGQRYWEKNGQLGRGRSLRIIACKKWHVAKRLIERLDQVMGPNSGVETLEYIFNEDGAGVPDLGGIENSVEKRKRHRRAFTNLVFERLGTDKLLICIDPTDVDVIRDFASDTAEVRVLEIECSMTDDYVLGHAMRVGLAGEMTPGETLERLVPTIRADVEYEFEQIKDLNLPHSFVMKERANVRENALALAQFLDLPMDQAHDIVSTHYLFAD